MLVTNGHLPSSSFNNRNLWLDLIRGVSAVLVCFGHLRNAMLVDYAALINPSFAIKMFYALTGFGHQAVMVFFVLSGYFVGGAVLRAGATFSWRNYLTARLVRLWVVLLPCLLITWLIGLMIAQYAPNVLAGVYINSWHSGPKVGEYSISFTTLLANIVFLQTIIAPVFGLNSPLWSLAYEFWYYLLFPFMSVAFGLVGSAGSAKYLQRAIAFLVVIILFYCLPSELLFGFLIWLMGVAVYCLQILQEKVKTIHSTNIYWYLFITIAIFGLTLMLSKPNTHIQNTGIIDFYVGFAFALLCLGLTQLPFPTKRWPWFASSTYHLSDISYSLYLSHFPVVILIASTVYGLQKFVPNGTMITQFIAWSFLLLMFGSAMWWLFESRTAAVRAKVNALFSMRLIKIFV